MATKTATRKRLPWTTQTSFSWQDPMNLSRWGLALKTELHPGIPNLLSRALCLDSHLEESSLEKERAGRIRERKLERILEPGIRRNEIRLISIIAGSSEAAALSWGHKNGHEKRSSLCGSSRDSRQICKQFSSKEACIRRVAPLDGRTRAIVSGR